MQEYNQLGLGGINKAKGEIMLRRISILILFLICTLQGISIAAISASEAIKELKTLQAEPLCEKYASYNSYIKEYQDALNEEVRDRRIDCFWLLIPKASDENVCMVYLERDKYPDYARDIESIVKNRNLDCLDLYRYVMERNALWKKAEEESKREVEKAELQRQQNQILEQQKRIEAEQARQMRIQNSLNMLNMGLQFLAPRPVYRPQTNCTTHYYGNEAQTICY